MNRAAGAGALLIVLVGGAILIAILTVLPQAGVTAPGTTWIGQSLWETRGLDLAAQALLVLAGVFGVLFVLGREEK